MATTPTLSGPRVASAGGTVPQQTQAFLDAGVAGTPAGQGAGLAAGLREFGQEVGQGADMAARQALQEQALTNEAMARDADTSAAVNLGSIMNEYQSLEGEKAVAAKDAYIGKMTAARAAALDSMPNPETRRMLDGVLSRRMGLYLDGVNRYAAGQQKAWQARSAQGAARVATDQAARFDNMGMPAVAEGLIESGVGSIGDLAEIHGWDPATTQAEQAKYRGNAYQTLISKMLGAGEVDRAAEMFGRVRNSLDAGAQAQISQMLKPQVFKQKVNTIFAGAMGTGPGTATTMFDAIQAQESGGRDSAVSVDGARGAMQIMPGTFRQWARPGESIDNPADNRAVGQRMLDSYQQQYGGDPERVAVAYFSGPGNVSEPGAPHPWKEDRKDGNGKSVSSYVADISKRLRTSAEQVPTYQRPDFDAAREKVPSLAGDDLELQAAAFARINQAETQYNSTTKVDRQALDTQLNATQAALMNGRDVEIPEVEIRRLYPKAQADKRIDELTEIRQLGQVTKSVALASPAEFGAMLAQYDDVDPANSADTPIPANYAQRSKDRTRLIQAWNHTREEIKKDPAVYAGRAPAVQALATQDAISAPGGAEAYARATLGEQERLGVAETERRVLPKAVTAGLVQKIMEADPEKTPAALVMGEIAKTYGGMWPAVFRDMVRSGLPAGYKVLGSMSADSQVGARADMQRAMAIVAQKGGESALREGAGKEHAKAIDDGLYSAMLPFAATTAYDTGGPLLAEDVRSSIKQLAYYYAGQGASGSQALSRAVTGVLDAKYDFVGTMRVPKGQADLTRDVTRGVQDALKIEDLAPVPEGPMVGGQRQDLLGVAKSGFWVPNANDDGLVLMGTYKVPGTDVPVKIKIKRADGGLVEIKFNQMDAMRNTQRASGARSPAAEANPWTPPSMMRTFDRADWREGGHDGHDEPGIPDEAAVRKMLREDYGEDAPVEDWLSDKDFDVQNYLKTRALARSSPIMMLGLDPSRLEVSDNPTAHQGADRGVLGHYNMRGDKVGVRGDKNTAEYSPVTAAHEFAHRGVEMTRKYLEEQTKGASPFDMLNASFRDNMHGLQTAAYFSTNDKDEALARYLEHQATGVPYSSALLRKYPLLKDEQFQENARIMERMAAKALEAQRGRPEKWRLW